MPCFQGNIAARAGDLMAARAHFMDAVSLEADCAEAIYNLGLVSKGIGNLEDALTAFKRLNAMLPDDTAAMFQVSTFHTVLHYGNPLRSGRMTSNMAVVIKLAVEQDLIHGMIEAIMTGWRRVHATFSQET